MHTPEQAAKLWCPMVRLAAMLPDGTVPSSQAVFNRVQLGRETHAPDSGLCFANKCAMWRWANGADGLGYCGLAPLHQVAA